MAAIARAAILYRTNCIQTLLKDYQLYQVVTIEFIYFLLSELEFIIILTGTEK